MGMRPLETKAAQNCVAHDGRRAVARTIAPVVMWRHSERPFPLAAAIEVLVLICAHGRVLQSKTMSSWILPPILVVLSQGGAHGAGLYRPDKEKRIQHGCEGNPWDESVQGWARRAVGYSWDPLMGSGRFGAKVTLLLEDILMKPFDWIACEGLRSQGSKCS